jgi:predicted Zn-dependent protease
MKAVIWVFVIAAATGFAYWFWHWERRRAELKRASEERSAAFMAQALVAAKSKGQSEQRLLFEAAAKTAEAGEPVLAIQLYARLLARYPDSPFAAQARAAVELQKKNLAKA